MFVPLTLGLSLIVAIMETLFVRTRDEEYRRLTKFWGKLFLINFAVGVVTGITLEFQFGTNVLATPYLLVLPLLAVAGLLGLRLFMAKGA